MKHATETLEGALLDYAVALAIPDYWVDLPSGGQCGGSPHFIKAELYRRPGLTSSWWECLLIPSEANRRDNVRFRPSDSWTHGGPLIERHMISITERGADGWFGDAPGAFALGPTPLIAAMRALVASKLGDEVEL